MYARGTWFRAPLGGLLGLAALMLLLPGLWADQGPAKADDKKTDKKAEDKKTPPPSDDKKKADELEKARAEVKQAQDELDKVREQGRAAMEKLFKARRHLAELEGPRRSWWRDGGERGRPRFPPRTPDRTADLEKKLDAIAKEVEEIKRLLKK